MEKLLVRQSISIVTAKKERNIFTGKGLSIRKEITRIAITDNILSISLDKKESSISAEDFILSS